MEILRELENQGVEAQGVLRGARYEALYVCLLEDPGTEAEGEEAGVVKVAQVGVPTAPIVIRVNDRLVIELDMAVSEEQLVRVLKAAAQV